MVRQLMSAKHNSILVGVVYFLILLSIALWVRDVPNQPDTFNLTLQQLIDTSHWGDPRYFATAAIDVAKNGWVSSENEWTLNLWPPGFILLEALIIKVFGQDVPAILILQILAALLHSIVLVSLYVTLRASMKTKVAFTLPLLIFAFPISRIFLLEPIGITFGETFAVGFFLLCIMLSYQAVIRNSFSAAIYAGIFLALSAYFRSQFEIILLALTGWGMLFLIAAHFTRLQKLFEPPTIKSTVQTIAVVLLVAHAATMPWRAYHWVYQGAPLWVQTASVTFGNSVKTSKELEDAHASFVVEGGGNLVCRIDPATCGDTANAKSLFINTFFEHPLEWYSLKLKVISKYWFSSESDLSGATHEPSVLEVAWNGLLLMAPILLVYLMFARKVRLHKSWILLVWFNATLFSAYFLIFTVQQFEVRYFYFPKIVGVAMLLIVASLFYQAKENKRSSA